MISVTPPNTVLQTAWPLGGKMKGWLVILQMLSIACVAPCSAEETVVAKRIDGGVLVPTTEPIKKLISACTPIRIVVSYVILEDGTTSNLEVVETEPVGVDATMSLEAVAKFQFEPIIVDGVAVRSAPQTQEFIYDPTGDPNCQ